MDAHARRDMALAAIVVGCVTLVPRFTEARPSESWRYPSFGEIAIYSPDRAPDEVVLFISGDGGWNLGVVGMAERLRGLGALVVGIDVRTFQRALESSGDCAYPAAALEELARAVQLRAHVPEYKRPILVGYSSGATLVYAALAAAPVESFGGGISLGFCPDIEIRKSLCRGRALSATPRRKGIGYDLAAARDLGSPWMVLQGDVDQVCAPEATRRFVKMIPSARLFWLPKVGHGFGVTGRWDGSLVEAYRSVARARLAHEAPAPSAPAVVNLPLVEVPAATSSGDLMAVMVSGDGGWAAIDEGVSGEFARHGVPVVGWNSLKYFWTRRTPDGAAADLARVIDHYRTAWHKARVLVVGYSFGADVLPYMVNRLPEATRRAVSGVGLIGLSPTASFEFRVSGWLSDAGDARYPTRGEVNRLDPPAACIVGAEERDSACLTTRARSITVPGGHHFGGDYARLARELLAALDGSARPRTIRDPRP